MIHTTTTLLQAGTALLPVAISLYGHMSPMFLHFLFETWTGTHYKFDRRQPMALKIYNQAMLHPAPSGVIPLATFNWRCKEPHTQYFYGHSYTAPTPHKLILKWLGLTISNAIALHIRNAKQGFLSPPAEPFVEDLQPPTTCPVGGRIVRPLPGLTMPPLTSILVLTYFPHDTYRPLHTMTRPPRRPHCQTPTCLSMPGTHTRSAAAPTLMTQHALEQQCSHQPAILL